MALPAGLGVGTGVGVERLGLGVGVTVGGGGAAVGVLVAVQLGVAASVGLACAIMVGVCAAPAAVGAEETAFTVGRGGSVGVGVAAGDAVGGTGLFGASVDSAAAVSWRYETADVGVELASGLICGRIKRTRPATRPTAKRAKAP